MLKLRTMLFAAVAVFGTVQLASAQGYYQNTHFHNVPHTTTHTDYIPHGNHVDAVPHTTTHFDRVPHTTYRPATNWYPRQTFVPQATTNFYPTQRYVPQYVPHTTTHFDRVRHGFHSHVVPHTTTHWHRR